MKATQDEHIPHQASLGPVVETKPIHYGIINITFTPFGYEEMWLINNGWIEIKDDED